MVPNEDPHARLTHDELAPLIVTKYLLDKCRLSLATSERQCCELTEEFDRVREANGITLDLLRLEVESVRAERDARNTDARRAQAQAGILAQMVQSLLTTIQLAKENGWPAPLVELQQTCVDQAKELLQVYREQYD